MLAHTARAEEELKGRGAAKIDCEQRGAHIAGPGANLYTVLFCKVMHSKLLVDQVRPTRLKPH